MNGARHTVPVGLEFQLILFITFCYLSWLHLRDFMITGHQSNCDKSVFYEKAKSFGCSWSKCQRPQQLESSKGSTASVVMRQRRILAQTRLAELGADCSAGLSLICKGNRTMGLRLKVTAEASKVRSGNWSRRIFRELDWLLILNSKI